MRIIRIRKWLPRLGRGIFRSIAARAVNVIVPLCSAIELDFVDVGQYIFSPRGSFRLGSVVLLLLVLLILISVVRAAFSHGARPFTGLREGANTSEVSKEAKKPMYTY